MSKMSIVDPRLKWFVGRMRQKLALKKNQAKSDWRGLSTTTNMNAISDEMNELANAYDAFDDSRPGVMRQQVIDECADVANRAMMLADQVKNMR